MNLVSRAFLALTMFALLSPGLAAAKPAPARDWSKSFAVSPAGGFVMGSPRAKVKLVEYGSLTCPHCRHFAQDAVKKFVRGYVRTGKVSWEFRPMVLNAADLGATLLARCGGPSRFFPIADTLYATQPVWTARVADVTEAELRAMPENQIALRMAERAQLLSVAKANGIAEAKARACLTDAAAQQQVMEIYRSALDGGIRGTPSFLINGKPAAVVDWESLQKALRAAGV